MLAHQSSGDTITRQSVSRTQNVDEKKVIKENHHENAILLTILLVLRSCQIFFRMLCLILAHAATSSVYSNGDCMHKVVKKLYVLVCTFGIVSYLKCSFILGWLGE